jgi:hypothetical protein
VLSAFASELSLKCIQVLEKGNASSAHDLALLFRGLSSSAHDDYCSLGQIHLVPRILNAVIVEIKPDWMGLGPAPATEVNPYQSANWRNYISTVTERGPKQKSRTRSKELAASRSREIRKCLAGVHDL